MLIGSAGNCSSPKSYLQPVDDAMKLVADKSSISIGLELEKEKHADLIQILASNGLAMHERKYLPCCFYH
jgi:hypothetical protein